MADNELEQLRAKRMQELQAAQGGMGGGAGSQQQRMEQQQQMEEMKHSILSQVLDQQARARLNTLAMTKPEKARAVENHLCQMARSGQLMNKFTEDQLVALLERISEQNQKKTVVNYDRRRTCLDSDED